MFLRLVAASWHGKLKSTICESVSARLGGSGSFRRNDEDAWSRLWEPMHGVKQERAGFIAALRKGGVQFPVVRTAMTGYESNNVFDC